MGRRITGRGRRPLTLDMFADLTPAAFTIERDRGDVTIVFDADLDDTTAQQVQARLESRNDVEATLRDRAAKALETNRTYLALTAPTAADHAAQVKALTRQMQALIRMTLGQLDSTD